MIQRLYEKNNYLEKALDASVARNDIIAQNLSNIDTPNYKRKDIAFEQYLAESLDKTKLEGIVTDKRHIAINSKDTSKIKPTLTQDFSETSMRIDGNNVDVDSEMAYLSQNQIKYNTLIQMINGSYSKLKNVISGGRG